VRAITAPRSSARRQDLYAQGRPAGLAWPGGLYAATLVRGYQTSVPHAMHVRPVRSNGVTHLTRLLFA